MFTTEESSNKFINDGMDVLFAALKKHSTRTAKKEELRGEMIINLLVNFMAAAYVKVTIHGEVSKEDNHKTVKAMLWHLEECIKHYEGIEGFK